MGYLFLNLVSGVHRQPPQILQTIAIVLGYPPESDSETLLLKTPHIWVKEHEKIKVVATWQLHT